ncbi:MAG: thiol reductant ABC exporter subunit CydD [Peptococcaceae bacterium]|nr:thiol reductant ABC exporter subunit CydD [Peptococcaceae bacterium]
MKMELPVRFQKNDRLYLAGVVLSGLLEALLIILQMYVISGIADAVFLKGMPVSAVQNEFFVLALLMAGVVVSARLGGWLADGLAFSVKDAVASLLLDKMDRLGGVYGSGTDSGSCMMLLTDGVERLEEFFARLLPQAVKTALVPVLFFIFIFPVDWVSGLLLLITVPIIIAFMMLIGRFSKSASEKQWRVLNRISGYLHDAMVYLPWLKLWGKAEESAAQVEKLANDFRVRTLKVMQVAFLSAFVLEFFTMIGVALVAVTLGVRLVEGMVDFQMALFVILLAPEFYVPLRTLGGKYHDSIRAMSALKDISAFLNRAEPVRGNDAVIFQKAPAVELNQAGYRYADSGFTLQNINLRLEAGTNTVIFGESGCGKSTLLGLVSGMKLADTGTVSWDGTDVKQLSLNNVREQIGFIGQEIYVFSGSVYDNIILGDGTITKEMVEEACVKLGFDRVVEKLEQGYDTMLGEGGRGLSGGQKRMLGIARIFVRNKYLVVCDEPLAGLDYISERMVYQALQTLLEGRTALLVSHREEIVHLADQIYWMEDGCLKKSGKTI